MKVFMFAWLLIGLLPHVGLGQQDSKSPVASSRKWRGQCWQANTQAGSYLVKMNQIISVSRHSYILDGVAIVDEVTVDTTGKSLARFYYLEPIDQVKEAQVIDPAVKRTREMIKHQNKPINRNAEDMAVKQYPLTTHAKTVEYRLKSRKALNILYASVNRSWLHKKPTIFTEY